MGNQIDMSKDNSLIMMGIDLPNNAGLTVKESHKVSLKKFCGFNQIAFVVCMMKHYNSSITY